MKVSKIIARQFSACLLSVTKKEMLNLAPRCPYLHYQPTRPVHSCEDKKASS